MNRSLGTVSLIAVFCLLPGMAEAQDLHDVLSRMDKAAPTIHAMTADAKMATYESVIDDTTIEDGKLQMQKLNSGEVRAIVAFKGANDARTIGLFGKMLEIYYPNVNQYQRIDLGKQGETADQLLLLGFGTPGTELAKSYDIQLTGSEKINGIDTNRLELTPKDPKVTEKLAKINLWIPVNAGYPVQQKFFDPPKKGNWRQVTYSNIDLSPAISGTLVLKLPKDAKKQS